MKAFVGLTLFAVFMFGIYVHDTTQGMAAVLGGWSLVAAGFSLARTGGKTYEV